MPLETGQFLIDDNSCALTVTPSVGRWGEGEGGGGGGRGVQINLQQRGLVGQEELWTDLKHTSEDRMEKEKSLLC